MFKTTFIVLISLLFFSSVKAQQDTLIYFVKNSGEVVTNKAMADFYILVEPPDKNSDPNLFIVKAYYVDGKLLYKATSTINSLPFHIQGYRTWYFANGNKRLVQNYEDDGSLKDAAFYYPDGSLLSIVYKKHPFDEKVFLKECRDSTGNVICRDGNGTWITYDWTRKDISKGPVADGRETGEWKGEQGDSITFTCTYKKGEIVSGIGRDRNGRAYPFKKARVEAKFSPGLDTFDSWISWNTHPPDYAVQHKIHGIVTVGFTVEISGQVDQVKIISGNAPSLNEAAVNEIATSPDWVPGQQYGVPVPMNLTITLRY